MLTSAISPFWRSAVAKPPASSNPWTGGSENSGTGLSISADGTLPGSPVSNWTPSAAASATNRNIGTR